MTHRLLVGGFATTYSSFGRYRLINIASYALLTMMVAQVFGVKVREFVHTLGEAHLISNHFDQVATQLSRTPRTLPVMKINSEVTELFTFTFDHFRLEGYEADASIAAPIAV